MYPKAAGGVSMLVPSAIHAKSRNHQNAESPCNPHFSRAFNAKITHSIPRRPLKDFPADKLDRWGIEAQHPDEFLTHQFHLSQPAFLQTVKTVRQRLKNPPKSVDDYLDTLRAQGLLATVKSIEPFDQSI
jgi:hypothetical protein